MREILKEHRTLNIYIYMMNILSNIIFMHRLDNATAHSAFLTKFCKPSHAHTNFQYLLKGISIEFLLDDDFADLSR